MEHKYKFDDFNWLGDMSGFNVPTDVFHGTILLGVIVSKPTGYVINQVLSPEGAVSVSQTKSNNFKTKNEAAKILHHLWKLKRTP